MTIYKFVLGMVVALTTIFCLSVTAAQARGGDKDKKDGNHGNGHTPVTLCHWAGNEQHGKYVLITVDDDGSSGNKNLQGHAGHDRDIIPAPAGGCPKEEEVPTETPCPTETPRPANTPTRTSTPNSPTPTATIRVNNPSRPHLPSSTPTTTATTIKTTSTVVVPAPVDRIKPPQTGNAGLAANR